MAEFKQPTSEAEFDKNFEQIKPLMTDTQAYYESSRCLFCYDAPCVAACPTGCLYADDDHVGVIKEKCIGCRNCVLACPYGAVDIVRRPPDLEPEAAPAQEQGSAPDDKEPKGARAMPLKDTDRVSGVAGALDTLGDGGNK